MLKNKKTVVLLSLVAVYAAYRYSRMSPVEKTSFKSKGRKLLEDFLPADIKNLLNKDTAEEMAVDKKPLFKQGL